MLSGSGNKGVAMLEDFASQSIMKALAKHKALLAKVGPVGETILLDAKANGHVNHRYLRGTSDQVKAELENAGFWNGEVTQGGEKAREDEVKKDRRDRLTVGAMKE